MFALIGRLLTRYPETIMSKEYEHGVLYLPRSAPREPALLTEQFEAFNISYVRVQWVDLINTVRCRILPVSYFLSLMKSTRPGLGVAKGSMGLVYFKIAPGFSASGEYLYAPDLSTMRISPYAPGEAVVMGWFQEKTPYIGADNKLTVDVLSCPRTNLKRIVQNASDAGVDFLVGVELEFVLLKSTKPVEPSNVHLWAGADGFLAGSVEDTVLKEIADGIQKAGIELQMYHAEGAPGQYEVVTGPLAPLEAADVFVLTRETIVNVAAKHGLRATFAPRVFMDSFGSSTHMHISVHSKDNIKTTDGLSPLESAFLASVLSHLPALTALTLPIPASYKRMSDGLCSGGTYVNWGTENREAPIRLSNATSPSSRNFEMRFVDGTSNPYLTMAGILGVGFAGIQDNAQLTIKDCRGPVAAAEMTEEARRELGITQRMSLTWEESRQRLSENKLFRKTILGPDLMDKYLSVNKTLAEVLELDSRDEAATLTRLVELY